MTDSHNPRVSRRGLLKLGGAAAAGALLTPRLRAAQAASAAGRSDASSARNIIFMVADGMSSGVPALAEAFSQLVRSTSTNWHAMSRDDVTTRGFFDMASLNSLVTDSAAAASAWAGGTRVNNWSLNVLPDGRPLVPIGTLAHDSGRAVGLVTTTRITHATPAAFASVCPNRDLEDDIAPQYLDRVDVLLGGGRKHFDPAFRADRRDLLAEYRTHGYKVCTSRDDLSNAGGGAKLLGLFDADHVPYTIDRNRDTAIQSRVPTLAEMTRAALESLGRAPDGFLLQVEGGRVDHAAHNNDAASLLWDQLAFDDAVGVALEFVAQHPDALLVITSDHGNSNPGLNGMGSRYHHSTACFELVAKATASYDTLTQRWNAAAKAKPDAELSAADIVALIRDGTGLDIDEVTATELGRVKSRELNHQHANRLGMLGQVLGNQTGIGWTGMSHTSDWTNILARGPGAARFNGLHLNTEAFDIMTSLFGISHRNPSMTPEEAARAKPRTSMPAPASHD